MLQNAYFVAKIGADTAENEQHSAEILPTDALSTLRGLEVGLGVLICSGFRVSDRGGDLGGVQDLRRRGGPGRGERPV